MVCVKFFAFVHKKFTPYLCVLCNITISESDSPVFACQADGRGILPKGEGIMPSPKGRGVEESVRWGTDCYGPNGPRNDRNSGRF